MKSLPGEFEYLDHCLQLGASDVHLTEDMPPRYRVSGRLCPRPDTTGTPRENLVPLLNVVVPEWKGLHRGGKA